MENVCGKTPNYEGFQMFGVKDMTVVNRRAVTYLYVSDVQGAIAGLPAG